MEPGKPEAQEFEYVRHGTQALVANFEVATGKSISPTVGETRTGKDFVAHIRATVEADPEGEWTFVVDQLYTHKSASLVRLVAELCGVEDDLGMKGKSGILKSMDSRADKLRLDVEKQQRELQESALPYAEAYEEDSELKALTDQPSPIGHHDSLNRGMVVDVNLEPVQGSETGKTRPCVIVTK